MPCIGNVPSIVASGSISKAAGTPNTIPVTTIYTPAAAGIFRVSIYFTTASGSASHNLVLAWTDENGSQSADTLAGYLDGANSGGGIGINSFSATGTGLSAADIVIHSSANAIQVSTRTGGSAAGTLYYTVEQLA